MFAEGGRLDGLLPPGLLDIVSQGKGALVHEHFHACGTLVDNFAAHTRTVIDRKRSNVLPFALNRRSLI